MSEFSQKFIIALVSAVVGGGLGFGTKVFMQLQVEEAAREEFARTSNYNFLLGIYEERKESYLAIEEARFQAFNDPSPENLERLLDELAGIPFIRPRLPTNRMILGFRDAVADELRVAKTFDETKDFLRFGMSQYMCVFDVNLQTIENMIRLVGTENEVFEFNNEVSNEDLDLLDSVCLKS